MVIGILKVLAMQPENPPLFLRRQGDEGLDQSFGPICVFV